MNPTTSFREYIALVRPDFVFHKHCEVIIKNLQRVADGELKRLMILMPPRYFASTLVSGLFSAYYELRHASDWVALASYSKEIANLHVATAYNYLGDMETQITGQIYPLSTFTAMTGKGFNLGIIDAPVKNANSADFKTLKQQQDWYNNVFAVHEEPNGAAQIVVMPRWDAEDLAGHLLRLEENEDWAEGWHIINLPALKDVPESEFQFPPSCTVEPDWRNVGDPLCPEIHSFERLHGIRRTIGESLWLALFQQNPFGERKVPEEEVEPPSIASGGLVNDQTLARYPASRLQSILEREPDEGDESWSLVLELASALLYARQQLDAPKTELDLVDELLGRLDGNSRDPVARMTHEYFQNGRGWIETCTRSRR